MHYALMTSTAQAPPPSFPAPSAIAELLKPVTWFPPMWAFGCGVVASGMPADGRWPLIVAGVLLAGPFVCATSQAVNDWFDRHVDAINEPQRPIPSGRMPGRWGLYVAIVWTLLSLEVCPRPLVCMETVARTAASEDPSSQAPRPTRETEGVVTPRRESGWRSPETAAM